MASNPPFLVEDQTDEDFFDKLVNDDDDDVGLKLTTGSGSGLGLGVSPGYVDGNGSDEVKTFDNLSINDDVGFKVNAGPGLGLGASPVYVDGNESDGVRAFGNLSVSDDTHSGVKVTTLSAGRGLSASPVFVDGNESDDVKYFANFSISDDANTGVDGVSGDSMKEGEKVDKDVNCNAKTALVVEGNEEKNSGSLMSLTSVGSDGLLESSSGYLETEVNVVKTENHTSGSGNSGVKEVGWSAFHADPVTNDASGFGSYMDFFSELGDNNGDATGNVGENVNKGSTVLPAVQVHETKQVHDTGFLENNTISLIQGQDSYSHDATTEQVADGQDVNSIQYWENLYPGWKYDASTGQWYHVDSYESGANVQGSTDSNLVSDWTVSDGTPEVSYLQKTAQFVSGNAVEAGTTESVTNWNQGSQVNDATENVANWNQASQASDNTGAVTDWNQASQLNNGYPPNMVFDPQYPGWYYDIIALEWRSLESYTLSAQSTVQAESQLDQNGSSQQTSSHNHDQRDYGAYGHESQLDQNGLASQQTFSNNNDQMNYGAYRHSDNSRFQGFSSGGGDYNWSGSFGNYNQHSSNMSQNENVAMSNPIPEYRGNQQLENHHRQDFSASSHVNSEISNHYEGTVPYNAKAIQSQNDQHLFSGGGFSQQFSEPKFQQHEQKHASSDYFGAQTTANYSQQAFQSSQQFAHAPTAGKSSAGRPPHALVTFGFGGKLIVMKDHSSFGSQNPVGGSISVLNLMDVVSERADSSSLAMGACDYTRALCRPSFPGPLVGGSPSIKELNRWIDERIANSESPDMDYQKGEVLRLLLSLLKIACQYYGKLRSPFGTEAVLKESDVPETAVARLFASVKRNGMQLNQYGTIAQCLQQLPSEGQMRASASEVQSLLVSGRKKEALQCAQEGQLWGPALVLAAQLGDQFYVETVKQMALRQLVAGSPLRTLCLLIAGQPADVFSVDSTAQGGMPVVNAVQQPAQFGANIMLDDWEENLAVITANRTKDDELVLIHLGDCLWKERSDIVAAHICYLVAEANFEQYSDTARLCLVGADHLKFPRTYASPEAIQRTEIYEYSKVLGNSQYILLPFQPYKLVYAHMLAEVGRISDALKYCQALSRSLKTGRTPETETLRQLVSSLEERIKTHQQGGFSTNLAPAKLVGKLLNLFDSTAHRVVGGLPPPMPTSGSSQGNEHHQQFAAPRVLSSQSTMAMSSLIPSEPIGEWAADNNRMAMHNRSVSEPDIGRTPRQVDSSKERSSSNIASNASGAGVTSRFRRFNFGSQLLQKTVGLVLKPLSSQGRQAKLGDTNKFYYDEKLKRWVEEGAELPAAVPPLAPPPTAAVFQNGAPDYNVKSVLKSESSICNNGFPEMKSPTSADNGAGIPPLPPTSNQFAARGRMGVRSRYVDTFNKGGGNPTNLFQPPSVPCIKPATAGNAKFFVPTPMSPVEETGNSTSNEQETSSNSENDSNTAVNGSFDIPAPTSSGPPMQRFASMDNLSNKGAGTGSLSAYSRRTASWSGSFPNAYSPNKSEPKLPGSRLSMPPSSFMPSDASSMHSSTNGGSFSDDLHEVDL
ncbi:protein transport protein SEC16B homolog isoform X2 [Lycium barbarum]|uniref:protein transport protein SEC16B homolog isoform X2 n=1 Tax=Lycium barbarum TaxID=112863 RepID=UPI00293EE4BD|nr:protein transport protein SEC16B homolog isoform X2 [Lycium barbarum]